MGKLDRTDVTIIICTYNRSAALRTCLESLCRGDALRLAGTEILLVDNNSPDDTPEVAKSFGDRLPLRYLCEPRQGKTFALNRGVAEARGDLLLFTDDDVELNERWVKEYRAAASRHPEAGWFGGRVFPWW